MGIIKLCCLLIVTLTGVSSDGWTYTGRSGPLYWHELFPDDCSGKYQSPIDIRPEETIYNPDLKNFAVWYDPPMPSSKMYLRNNGHTVQVNLEGDFYVTNGGLPNVYKAIQFHFHWGHKIHHGSEHLIDGKPSPIELHLVTYNTDLYLDINKAIKEKGGIAVLGVMYEISTEDNPTLTPIIEAFKHIRDPGLPSNQKTADLPLMSIRDLLPLDITRYYRYNGSLTTPGCFESVIWTVFDSKQTISHKQLKEFTTILQFKHKHTADKKAEERRHRRSLTRAQREKERKAENVLDELGIRGNKFQEEVLKSELMQDIMMADMSQEDTIISVPEPSPKPEQDEYRVAKTEQSSDDHNGVNTNTKHKTDVHHSKQEDELLDVEESIFTQEAIVNNFRPVQPLNDRIVYRSFKLREKVDATIGESHSANINSSGIGGDSSASKNILSTASTVVALIVGFFFV